VYNSLGNLIYLSDWVIIDNEEKVIELSAGAFKLNAQFK